MKKIFKLFTLSLLLMIAVISCTDKDIVNEKNKLCENMKILKVFKNEPATVQKRCFFLDERQIDAFYFVLENEYSEFFSHTGVFPVGEISEKYRVEGLPVYISGNVTSCTVGGCSTPNNRLAPFYLFELKSIKIKNLN